MNERGTRANQAPDVRPETMDERTQVAWKCQQCQQLNSWWAKDCGRCERPRDDAATTDNSGSGAKR